MTYCPNFSNKKVKLEFEELKRIFTEDGAYYLWNKNNGYGMESYPNGLRSMLYNTVLSSTGDRTSAIKAVASNLANESEEFMFSKKQTSEAKYNYGRSVKQNRLLMEEELRKYYMEAYDFSPLIESFKQNIESYKKKLAKTFYDDQNADTEEEKLNRVNSYKNTLRKANNPFIKDVRSKRNNNGSITVYVETYTAEEMLDKKMNAYFSEMSDDDLFSSLLLFEQEELSLEMYHINPKRIPLLRQQILSKNPVITEKELDQAFEFLVELENTLEDNAYVECCLKWLKAGTIYLPFDDDKVRHAFDLARKQHIDIQKCKSPIDVYLLALKKPNIIRKESKVDPNTIPYFHLADIRKVGEKEVFIYNVDDSVEGATAVAQFLSDTGLYDVDKEEHIPFSPWCLSVYKVNKEGKVTLEQGAIERMWPRYNGGKRQIAVCNGAPVAFNSSMYNKDEWWDFYDNSHSTIEEVDLDAPANKYDSEKTKSVGYDGIFLGNFWYFYHGPDLENISTRYDANDRVDFDISKDRVRFKITTDDKIVIEYNTITETVVVTDLGSGIVARISHNEKDIPARIYMHGCYVFNIYLNTYPNTINKITKLKNFVESLMGKFDVTVLDIYNPRILNMADEICHEMVEMIQNSQQSNVPSTPEVLPSVPSTSSGTEAAVEVVSQVARQLFAQPITLLPRRNEYSGIPNGYGVQNGYDVEEDVLGLNENIGRISTSYSDYAPEEVASDKYDFGGITKTLRRTIVEIAKRKTLFEKYKEYLEKPVNEGLAKKLHEILKKYDFEVIEAPLKEVFGEDVLGAYDVFLKIIYLTNKGDRDAITDAEEFSHAFFKMMGAVYRKNLEKYPHAALYHKLRDLVEQTQFYTDALEEYKDNPLYKYKRGNVNEPKVKEEALGKALAAALNNRYDIDHSFIKRVLRWFESVIDWFKSVFGKDTVTLEKELDRVAKDILKNNYKKYLDVLDHSNWRQITFEETVEKDVRENDGFGIKFMKFASSLGGYICGSFAVRQQGALYRAGVESLHDIDVAFPLSLHKLHTHADFENHNWTAQEIWNVILESEGSKEIVSAFLTQYPNMRPIGAFAKNNNVIVNFMICDDSSLYDRFVNLEGNFNSRMSKFTEEELKQIHLVDLFFNDSDVASKKAAIIDDINLSNYRNSFAEKLSWSRPKDLIDYQLWKPFEREYKVDLNSAIFYHMSQQDSSYEESPQEQTDESIFEQVELEDKSLDDYIRGSKKGADALDDVTEEWALKRQSEIIGETQRLLAEAFGLTLLEDGSWVSEDNTQLSKLRVLFVNNMSNPGSIDFDNSSINAHTTISIGLNQADASTFNHELAHYYIRTFWNSKAVQDALDMVYVKEMGDYKNDSAARIAVEEALADYITQRSIDSMFLTNIESKSFVLKFWESFNKMLYQVFDIKTTTAKRALLDQITRSFIVNEKLSGVKKHKYLMHKGTMHQTEFQKRKMRTRTNTVYQLKDRENFENTVGTIVKAIQSKAKSYELKSKGSQDTVYGDEDQIAFNQESVRIIKQSIKTIEELQQIKDDVGVLREKINLFRLFLHRADIEINKVYRIFKNAQQNDKYKKVMYEIDAHGLKLYTNAAGEYITSANATANTKERPFDWDDVVYAREDIVGFFSEVIKNIGVVASRAAEYGIDSAEAAELLDFINTTGLSEKIEQLDLLYKEAQKTKVRAWIDQTVEERTELDADFKQRLRINMYKWLDQQMDFGDVKVVEAWAGIASMSKSPIIRAVLDEISRMQQERDEAVYKKGLELRNQLEKARKQLGWKYRSFIFNVQKLLLLLDNHGLPTGQLISKFNDGQYRKDLENYKNKILFGKDGIEKKIKNLTDASGNPIVAKDWRLLVNEFGEPIFPDAPECEPLEREYLKLMEVFKSDKVIRRFTPQYYIDRINTLSVKTLRALNNVQDRIDKITEAITINGKPCIYLLTPDQQLELKTLYDEKDQLGSLTDLNGNYKVPGTDEYQIADEIRRWRIMTRGKIMYSIDWASFQESKLKSKDKTAFKVNFTKYVVNPLIWNALERQKSIYFPDSDPDVQRLKELKYDRAKLTAPYKSEYEIGLIQWDKLFDEAAGKIKNEKFFETLKNLDQEISELLAILFDRYKSSGVKKKKLQKVLEDVNIPANLIPGVTNWSTAETQYDFMIRRIKEVVDADPTLSSVEKALKIFYYENLLLYHDAREDVDLGLSLFSVYLPLNSQITEIAGLKYQSFVVMPSQIFQKPSGGSYFDTRYDESKGGLQLSDKYKDKRYKEFFECGNDELDKLLEDVKNTMKESWSNIPILSEYDNRAAQVGARNGQIIGRRWYNLKLLGKNFLLVLKREWEVVETDTDFLQEPEYDTRPDGTKIQNIPLRYIKRLDNVEYINSDVVGSTILFYDMATNYKIKTKHISKLTSILTQLTPNKKSQTVGKLKTSQNQIMAGMLGRQVYEDILSDTNDNEAIIEDTWNHFDWFRKHIISTPASWIKRVRKSRAAFLLGLLALNISSGIISFLDPLISLAIDSFTGKYINAKDLIYATGMMSPFTTNVYGNIASLGSSKQHSKTAAAMQRFGLSKRVTDSFRDLDKGSLFRFVSDGITMKHFTLGDYTINTINIVSTMHNYKYYKKSDGTAGFYPKHIFIKTVMDDLHCSIKEARKEYNNAVCMWASCTVDNLGAFVASNNEYGNAITDEVWNDVKSQIRSRSSVYNGIVTDIEKTAMQTSVLWSFLTMVRNFFITGIWERFLSYNDFLVASLDEDGNPIDRPSTREERKIAKKELRYYKGGYNFNTRQIEDGIDRGAVSWILHAIPYLKFAMFILSHNDYRSKYTDDRKQYMKQNNISQTDIYGIQKIFMEVIAFTILLLLSSIVNKVADDDDNKDDYKIQMANLILMRLAIERATWMNPSTAMDLISSPTAALSDWRRKLKLVDLLEDALGLSEYNLNDEVKRGRYAGAERWKYNLFNGLSSFGLNNWYADMPSWLGGGGERAVREKTNFYRGLIKKLPFGRKLFGSLKENDNKSSKKNKKQKKNVSNIYLNL